LKKSSPQELNQLKTDSGLSGKKWDAATKGLSKHQIIEVKVEETGKWIYLK